MKTWHLRRNHWATFWCWAVGKIIWGPKWCKLLILRQSQSPLAPSRGGAAIYHRGSGPNVICL